MKRSEGENTKKRSLTSRIKESYKAERAKGDMLEVHGREALLIRGCKKILFYSTTEIRLQLRTYILTVRGEKLYCTTYFYDAVSIEGKISSIEMSEVTKK